MTSLLLFCDSDSQVFAGIEYARAFGARGWATTFMVPRKSALAANAQLVLDSLDTPVVEAERKALAYLALEKSFSAVGLFTSGSMVKAACDDLKSISKLFSVRRPVVFTAFNGLVFEKFEEGLFWRLGCDIIGLNGRRDKILFDEFLLGREKEAPKAVLTGLHRGKPGERVVTERRKMVFCEQIIVPGIRKDRSQMFSLLAKLAESNPEWDVAIKPRIAKGEKSFHAPIYHPADYFDKLSIPNLTVDYRPLDMQLAEASLLGTVSSTAVFDGLNHGVPFFTIGNFGVSNKYGTHVFVPSGVMVNLRPDHSLDKLLEMQVSPAWLEWVGYSPAYTFDAMVDAVEQQRDKPLSQRKALLSELDHTDAVLKRTNKDVLAARLATAEKTRQVGALVDYALAATTDQAHLKAIQALELAHADAPRVPLIVRTLALMLVEAGEQEKALTVIRGGLELLPKNYSFQLIEERLSGRRRPPHQRLMRYLHILARKSKLVKN